MTGLQENIDLKRLNTFGVSAKARYFIQISSPSDLTAIRDHSIFGSVPVYLLGGGSNVLFTRDLDGLVLHCCIPGIRTEKLSNTEALVTVGAGESWHGLVTHCVRSGLGGLENLALIPGQCGAAPIQNIGAYGSELESVLEYVEGMDLRTGAQLRINRQECRFGYRDSIFKHDFEKKFFISSITLRLTVENHRINDAYDALAKELHERNIKQATIRDVYEAVVSIRRSKLPDPAVTGNAGSFFKNPIVTAAHASALRASHPGIPVYNIDNQFVKIPAGWLIERAGWKGKRQGRVGVHDRQALVIVNIDGASGMEIFDFSQLLIDDVRIKFGIALEREVNII